MRDVQRDELLTFEEARDFLKVSDSTLRRWVRNMDIPYRRVGRQLRFLMSELLEWSSGVRVNYEDEMYVIESNTRDGTVYLQILPDPRRFYFSHSDWQYFRDAIHKSNARLSSTPEPGSLYEDAIQKVTLESNAIKWEPWLGSRPRQQPRFVLVVPRERWEKFAEVVESARIPLE